jgi:hypothetical protein
MLAVLMRSTALAQDKSTARRVSNASIFREWMNKVHGILRVLDNNIQKNPGEFVIF